MQLDSVSQQINALRINILGRLSSTLLTPTEALSEERWQLTDQLVTLRNAVYSSGHSSSRNSRSRENGEADAEEKTVSAFEALEAAQERLATLEAGRRWLEVLSRIAQMR